MDNIIIRLKVLNMFITEYKTCIQLKSKLYVISLDYFNKQKQILIPFLVMIYVKLKSKSCLSPIFCFIYTDILIACHGQEYELCDWVTSNTFCAGLIVGAFIRYIGSSSPVLHMAVHQDESDKFNLSLPPDSLWLHFSTKGSAVNKTYAYGFRGEIVDLEGNEIDLKVNNLNFV